MILSDGIKRLVNNYRDPDRPGNLTAKFAKNAKEGFRSGSLR